MVGYNPWGRKELDKTERLPFLFLSFFLSGLFAFEIPDSQG